MNHYPILYTYFKWSMNSIDLLRKKISKFNGKVIIENIKSKGALSKTLDGKLSKKYLSSVKKNFDLKLKSTFNYFEKKYK